MPVSSHYVIVRFVPSPEAEEFTNIAVIVFDRNTIRINVCPSRLHCIGWDAMIPVATCVNSVLMALESSEFKFYAAQKLSEKMGGMVQISSPRGSLDSVDKLLHDTSSIFLAKPSL